VPTGQREAEPLQHLAQLSPGIGVHGEFQEHHVAQPWE